MQAAPPPGHSSARVQLQEEHKRSFRESRWPCGVPGRTKTYDIENILDTCMQYCLLTYINQLMSITKIRFSAASVRGATHNA